MGDFEEAPPPFLRPRPGDFDLLFLDLLLFDLLRLDLLLLLFDFDFVPLLLPLRGDLLFFLFLEGDLLGDFFFFAGDFDFGFFLRDFPLIVEDLSLDDLSGLESSSVIALLLLFIADLLLPRLGDLDRDDF